MRELLQFESPAVLLLLLALLPYLLYARRKSYADLAPARSWQCFGLRLAGLTLLLLALSRPVLLLSNSDRAVLFLVDVSESVSDEALEQAWQRVRTGTEELDGDQQAGLVLFARTPWLVLPLGTSEFERDEQLEDRLFHRRGKRQAEQRVRELERQELDPAAAEELQELQQRLADLEFWRQEVGVDESDPEAACRLGRALLPNEARGRLVLCTDGNQTRGDLLRETAQLKAGGFGVHVAAMRAGDRAEVLAERLVLPAEARIQAPFDMELLVRSSYDTPAVVKIYRNKFLLLTEEVELKAGRNLLPVPKVALDEGFHEFEAVVAAPGDETLENNVARGAVRVAGRPKVLLIEREEGMARYLVEALGAEEIRVEMRPPAGIPREMNELLDWDALVLSDVEAAHMSPRQMDMIKRYVREMGGGLVMLGGEHSFGLGGYYRTPIEEALPVKMPIRKNVEKPNLALVLVIDKSGSMGGAKIELAKEAAIASAEVLKPEDNFGVVAFDEASQWICPITSASERDAIVGLIGRLAAGGGTNIYPALYDAYMGLGRTDAKLKHIILLSDGQTQGSGYRNLVSHIAADGITLSTVAIGEGADRQLLGNMAGWAGGESYFTNQFSNIPQIITRETMRATKSMIVEEPFLPVVTASSEVFKGLDLESMPFLLGYVATQAKDTATVALSSPYGDPVFATWRYGLGRSAAFTSDAKARWAGDWIGWEGFGKFWAQLLRSVMSTGSHHDLSTRARIELAGGRARLALDVRGRNGEFRDDIDTEVQLIKAGAEPRDLEVVHAAPGLFRAEFPVEEYGDYYRLMVVQRQQGEVVGLKALAVTESYSPEYRAARPDLELLRTVAEETGGSLDPAADTVWTFEGEGARTPRDTWWWWLLAACLLLPLDIAARRTGFRR